MRLHRASRGAELFDQYQRIQAFKENPNSVIDGVNYAKVVAEYLYDRSVSQSLKIAAFSFFFTARTDVSNAGRGLLNFYSHRNKDRRDYDFIAETLVEIAGAEGDRAETAEKFSVTQWWFTLAGVSRAWRATLGYQAPLAHRLCATVLVAKYASTAERFFRSLVSGRTRVVTFCDAAPHDNLIAQLAGLSGALTVTLQHGQYRLLDARNMSSDAEAYANFVSDRILCWGEATCREFERFGISRDRMVVTGWIRNWDQISQSDTLNGTFGVMLNGGSGAGSNINLLRAANQLSKNLGLRFVVRLHPQDSAAQYRTIVNSSCVSIGVMPADQYLAVVDFSVAHMSGAAIEMLECNSPVYILDDGHLADVFRLPGLSFNGVEELLAAIQEDRLVRDHSRHRTEQLKRWFNDDRDQSARIAAVLLGEEV